MKGGEMTIETSTNRKESGLSPSLGNTKPRAERQSLHFTRRNWYR